VFQSNELDHDVNDVTCTVLAALQHNPTIFIQVYDYHNIDYKSENIK